MAEMPFGTFSVLTFIGGLTWAFALALAGDALAANWQGVSSAFAAVSTISGVLIVAGISLWVLRRLRAPCRLGVPPEAAASSPMTTPTPAAGSHELFDRR
jgi:membrane protein DedA with SNARE-associated domain